MITRFDGKVAVVTGATMGIGRAAAHRLHGEGASIIAVARGQARGDALVSELGERVAFIGGDVAHPETAELVVEMARGMGGPDVLVNNAALDHTNDLLETPPKEVREVLDLNFFGAMWMIQRCGTAMKERGGAIINLTSRLASIGVPTMGVYAASKGALLSLTKTAAIELAPHGIRVNAVAPGLTETPLLSNWIAEQEDPAAFRERVLSTIPQKRFARPADVAAAVAFLASDEAAHITGISLPVDGGYTAA